MKACHRVVTRFNSRLVYFSPVVSRQRAKAIFARVVETSREDIALLWPNLQIVGDGHWADPTDPNHTYIVEIINTKHTALGI